MARLKLAHVASALTSEETEAASNNLSALRTLLPGKSLAKGSPMVCHFNDQGVRFELQARLPEYLIMLSLTILMTRIRAIFPNRKFLGHYKIQSWRANCSCLSFRSTAACLPSCGIAYHAGLQGKSDKVGNNPHSVSLATGDSLCS